VGVWCAHNLVSSSGGSSRRRRSSSGVEPSKCLEREHVECRPAEVGRIEPAKRRAVSSKGGHAAFCVGRESADGLTHSGLGSSDKVLCAPGRAWTRGSRRGQLIERELGGAADPAVYTLLLLRSPIEGEAEWGVGVTCLGGARERGNEACRSIPRWESSEGR